MDAFRYVVEFQISQEFTMDHRPVHQLTYCSQGGDGARATVA